MKKTQTANLSLQCLDDIGEPLEAYLDQCESLTSIIMEWARDTKQLCLKRLSVIPLGPENLRAACGIEGWYFHDVPYDPVRDKVYDPWHPEVLPMQEYLAKTFPKQHIQADIMDH